MTILDSLMQWACCKTSGHKVCGLLALKPPSCRCVHLRVLTWVLAWTLCGWEYSSLIKTELHCCHYAAPSNATGDGCWEPHAGLLYSCHRGAVRVPQPGGGSSRTHNDTLEMNGWLPQRNSLSAGPSATGTAFT